MKRYFLTIALMLAMVLSTVTAAFAFTDVSETADYANALNMLEEISVYRGYPDGTAKPGNPITRAEFAAVVVRMLDQESLAQSLASDATGFNDDASIASWARGYIIVATTRGIITGYPDGTFKPANNVTFAEAIAMLTRALEVDEAATGTWPMNYMVLGADVGLTDGVDAVANVPITRGEMAIMTANAMMSEWRYTEEDGLTEDAKPLLYLLDEDVYDRYRSGYAGGVITDYLPSSGRILVSGTYYNLTDGLVEVVVNEGTPFDMDWTDWDDGTALPATLVDGDEVELTLDSSGEVTRIEVTRDTYKDMFLEDIATETGETEFGYVTVDGDDFEVDDDTDVRLDGASVSLADLEDAYEDFVDEHGENPIVTVRTVGDYVGSGKLAIYVSVLTDNTVNGEATSFGNDGKPYVRIDGQKVYYDDTYLTIGTGGDFTTGDTVTLLLNSEDVAMVLLKELIAEDDFFAKVLECTLDAGDLDTVTLEKADGTEVTLDSFVAPAPAMDVTTMLNEVVEVAINTNGEANFLGRTPAGMITLAVGPFVDYSATWIDLGGTKYVLDDDFFVYDADTETYIGLDDIDPGDVVYLYEIDGVAGYVVKDN